MLTPVLVEDNTELGQVDLVDLQAHEEEYEESNRIMIVNVHMVDDLKANEEEENVEALQELRTQCHQQQDLEEPL